MTAPLLSRRDALRLLAATSLLSPLLAACAGPLAAAHPLAGRLWSPAEGRFLSESEAMARLAAARFVLLGERHDNPEHHRLQAQALAALVAAGRRPAVAWEMLDAAQAPALAAFLAQPRPQAADLGPAVGWEASGWPDWAFYQPIAEVALAHGLPLRAANLDRAAVRAVARSEDPLDLPAAVEAVHRAAVVEGHCNLMPADKATPMVRVQAARDAAMAEAVLTAPVSAADGVVLIAGAGHVRTDAGVPWALRRRLPSASLIALACVEVEPGLDAPESYARMSGSDGPVVDLLWFTAAHEREDPCEALRAHMKPG